MVPIGLLLGFNFQNSLLLGMVVSLSSTMVVLKTLSDRGELHSLHDRLLARFLLVQDLAFVPMIAILPALNGGGSEVLEEIGLGLLKATSVLLGMVLLGTKVVPWMMDRITRLGSREIFILTVVATAFAIAALTDYIGLSAALGAFVAGLLLSESDFGRRALSEVRPAPGHIRITVLRLIGDVNRPHVHCGQLRQRAVDYRVGGDLEIRHHHSLGPGIRIFANNRIAQRPGQDADRGVQLHSGGCCVDTRSRRPGIPLFDSRFCGIDHGRRADIHKRWDLGRGLTKSTCAVAPSLPARLQQIRGAPFTLDGTCDYAGWGGSVH